MLRAVAALTALVVIGLTINALFAGNASDDRAPGLAGSFAQLDGVYQQRTQAFSQEAKELSSADLRTALRLYGEVLDAAEDAHAAVLELAVVDLTAHATDRLEKALRAQANALEDAVAAVRERDDQGAARAGQQFQIAVLAYQAARQQMVTALQTCGSRCR